MNTIIDVQVGPFDSPEAIEAEIEKVRALGDTPEAGEVIDRLKLWLERAKKESDK